MSGTIIWGFETNPDNEYSVIMPTETNLIFCGFFDTKEEAEAYAKDIHGIVLHDMRYARG